MERTLLLNATFEPLKIISWQRAITLLTQGKVEVIDFYDRDIRGVSLTFRLPSILRLLKLVKIRRASREVRFSRANIYQRDKYVCQYCGVKYPAEDLTFDHVIPQVQGGTATWENIVTACLCLQQQERRQDPAGGEHEADQTARETQVDAGGHAHARDQERAFELA